jgi:organic radical activating enzyme
MKCNVAEHGFDCDTDFSSGDKMTAEQIFTLATCVRAAQPGARGQEWVIFTGGEPLLQLDGRLYDVFVDYGWMVAVETNGTMALRPGVFPDWISCSPKGLYQNLKLKEANELRYVITQGQGLPVPSMKAEHETLLRPRTLEWCIELVLKNPAWRLSVQQHKAWGVR